MQAIVANSIESFSREEWNHLFAGELEDWNYYRAVERANLPDFDWLYFAVREHGRLCAAVPAFLTDYRLDTTVSGGLRQVTNAVARVFPGLMHQRMLTLGSPVAEVCHLGFASDIAAAAQSSMLDAMLDHAEQYAQHHRVAMIAIKDATQAQDQLWSAAARRRRLRRQPGLPTAHLDIDFADLGDYLQRLSRATRRDIRRKLRAASGVRVEWRRRIDDVAPEILEMYRSTRANAQYQFEQLTAEYFAAVLTELDDRASCAVYWVDDRPVAFNLLLHDGDCLLDKFLGMDYAAARQYNLYFLSWMENVRYCIEHGIARYQSGQGLHGLKQRLGSRLSTNWLWYRHRNRFVDALFARLERAARLDRQDPDLAALIDRARR